MINQQRILYKQLLIIWLFFIFKVHLINVVIKNDEKSMRTFTDTINNISNSYDANEINIQLKENYYPICTQNRNFFNVQNTLIFNGNSSENTKTIFDFQRSSKTTLNFILQPDSVHKKIIFKNITFQGYVNEGTYTYMLYLYHTTEQNDFQVIFENCTFTDIHGLILYIRHGGLPQNHSTDISPHVVFNHCNFL